MAGRFVRASKYRHVYGQPSKKELCYDNLRLSKNAWDTNLIKVNPKYAAVNWEVGGGGAFAVIPLNETGKVPESLPLFRGHAAAVLDTDWNPFDDQVIASASDDAKVGIYRVPDEFGLSKSEEPQDVMPMDKLSGHTRKVGHVAFNPAAANVLASSSGDYTIRLWDINKGSTKMTLKHTDMVPSLSWSADGSTLATTCRDKKLRYWDVRQEKVVLEVPGHAGAKNSRVVWLGEHDRVLTTGFSRMSDRQMALWDLRKSSEPLGGFQYLDSAGGICMPFWDDGTQMLYLAGKGDGNIRYYEYDNDALVPLSEYKSADPQRGLAFMPKRGVNVHDNEIMRAFKTVNETYIEPISFRVPRRAEIFQEDIFPPTTSDKPAMSSEDYFDGKPATLPPKISMESIYNGTDPKTIAASTPTRATDTRKVSTQSTSANARSAVQSPISVPSPSKPLATSSVSDSKTGMANLAAKFADKDDEPDSDDTSSFEEVQKPTERLIERERQQLGSQGHAAASQQSSPTKTSSAPAPIVAEAAKSPVKSTPATTAETAIPAEEASTNEITNEAAEGDESARSRAVSGGAKGAADGIRGMLQDMKTTIAQQGKDLLAQAEKIEALTREVAALKSRA